MLNPYIEAHELRELVRKRGVRPREVAEFFLARVEKLNAKLGAFMTVTAERALADASRLEFVDKSKLRGLGCETRRVNVDFPASFVGALDRGAGRLGVTRPAGVKLWITEQLGRAS